MDALDFGEHLSRKAPNFFSADLRGLTLIIKHFTAETPPYPKARPAAMWLWAMNRM
jgi:hypothetical protein